MQAIKGIYHNGRVELSELPKKIRRAQVIVTFLDAETPADDFHSVSNLGEILCEDLEGASREISETFNRALAESTLEPEN